MIVSKVMGGIGNQLYIWANARSLQLDGIESYIEISHYQNQTGMTQREFLLDKFPFIKYNLYTGQQNGKQFNQIGDDFVYKSILDNENHNTYLNGYWQSEKYFEKHKGIIISELLPSSDTIMKLSHKYPILNRNSISLHVRRGDYINQQQNHPVQPIEYYLKAMEIMGNDYDQLYIFSDDIEWCRQNFNFKNSTYVQNDSELEDFWMMAMCKHNIIANSSFSWWAAYLNSNPDKTVVCPNLWFGPGLNLSTVDLIPESWLKI